MSITPSQFFTKNMKWITFIFMFLFLFKSIQSCNRKNQIDINSKKYIEQIDSLKIINNKYNDSIKRINFLLEIENNRANYANERASAVQNAVEKLKSNTTIVVKSSNKN